MKSQRGGFAVGLVVGLLIGLVLALGVALYVTKVPVPFINKVPQRTAEQDAAEAEKLRTWDPNAPLAGKPGAAKAPPGATPALPAPAASPPVVAAAPAAVPRPVPQASTPPSTPPAASSTARAAAAPASAASAKAGADPFTYFVQAGAYAKTEDAEAQRAKLAMLGFPAKVTEREQSGRTMYRVRLGPFDKKEQADQAKDKLAGNGVESALVRVQK